MIFCQRYDTQSGLDYNYFRNYDPATGRYIESDPIGLAGGISTYGYANSAPLRYADPTGNNPVAGCIAGSWAGPVGCGAGAVVGLIVAGVIISSVVTSDSHQPAAPSFSTPKQESIYDRVCKNRPDPCTALKTYIRSQLAIAQGKISDARIDKNKLYTYARSVANPSMTNSPTTWDNHIMNIQRLKMNIGEALGLAAAMGCDVSQETAMYASLHVPSTPLP